MLKIQRGDIAQVTGGRDRGKKGKVLSLMDSNKRAIVEGINLIKKHKRKTQQDQQGGVVSVEAPISVSSLMLICKHCSRPVRVGFVKLKDGTKTRLCKSCKESI